MSVSQEFMDSALSGLDAQPEALPATTVSPDFLDAVIEPAGPAYVDRAPTRRASLASATGVNPDQYARARSLGARYGLPPTLVENHLDELEQRALLEDTDTLANDAPGLASALEDPEFAKLAHDEIEPLGMIERGLRALPAGLFNLSAGIYGLGETAGELISIATGPIARAGLLPEDPGQRIAQGFRDIRQGQQAMAKSVAGDRSDAGFVEQAVYGGIESIGMNAPGILAAIMTGQPAFALAPMVASTGGQGITQSLDKGVPVQQAIVRGASDAVVEYAFERTPLLTLLKNVDAGAPFMKTVLTNLAQEIPAEQVTTVLQDLNEWAVDNPDKPFASYIEERPSAAASTLISTIVGSGGQTAIAQGAATVAKTMDKRRQQADAATAHAEALAKISAQAAAVALKTRDPAMFRQAVEKMAAGSPDLYIDGSVLMQEFEGADETKAAILAAMPTVAAQLAEAGPTNGVVRVPVAEFLAAAPGTGIDEAMLPHLRTAPDGPSAADAEVFYQQEAEQTKAEAEKVMAQMQGDEVFVASAQAVEDTLMAELEGAGRFTTDVNKTYATLARDFYVTTAARTGMTPEQVYQQYPLRVRASIEGGERLDQNAPDTPEFKAWFGNSAVRDESGAPLVVYHGSANNIEAFQRGRGGLIFFSTDPEFASSYAAADANKQYMLDTGLAEDEIDNFDDARRGANITPAYVSAQNIFDSQGMTYREAENPEFTARLREQGYDGIWIYEQGRRNLAVFDPTQIKSATGNRGTFDPNDPNILNQGKSPRGAFNPATNTISLLNNADLSTFVHELGHFQLTVLADLAAQPNAPAQIVDDMNKLLAWFGVQDLDTWNAMSLDEQRPSHEKLARGMEAYLFEGKAPSTELMPVFARIKGWMLRVYRSLADLNVTLTDEVRGVFDRLYASDQAITEAEEALALAPLFATREDFPGTDEEWAEYKDTTDAAHEDAAANLQSRSLRDMQWTLNYRMRMLKKAQKDAKAKRAQVQAEVEAEVAARQVYAVQQFLRDGTVAEGALGALSREQRRILTESGLQGSKLSLEALKRLYGEGEAAIWRYLPTGKNGLVAATGADPELVAKLFSYQSADEMVRDVLAAETFDATVEAETDRRMLERYGDLSSPESIERAVNEAIHNTVRTRAIATELAALEKGAGPKRDMTALLKRLVKQSMLGRTIGNIRPAQHVAAEARAGREAQSARRTGKVKDAINAKRQQLWHHLSAIEARRVESEIERSLKYLRKFNKAHDSITPEHLERIQDLLVRVDLHKGTTQKTLRDRDSLTAWLNAEEERTGIRPVISKELENEANSVHYRNMTLEQFRGLVDTVKSFEHIGRRKQKLLTTRDKRELAETATALAESANLNAPTSRDDSLEHNRFSDRLGIAKDLFFAAHRKFSSLMAELDGFKPGGPWFEALIAPMNRAQADKAERQRQSALALIKLFKPVTDRAGLLGGGLTKRMVIPGVVDRRGRPISLSYEGRLMVALNAGNEGNLQRLQDGDGWDTLAVRGILDTLTKEDWNFVQGVWDYFDTFKPEIAALDKDVKGVEPTWLEAVPVDTKFGQYRGGYFPAMYDSERSTFGNMIDEIHDLSSMYRGAMGRPTTNDSFTQKRAAVVKDRPLRKDFGAIFKHVTDVNNRLSMERYLHDARRLLNAKPVQNAIMTHLGPKAIQAIKDLQTDIAKGDSQATNWLDSVAGKLSSNASIAIMGWQAMTAATQILGFTQTIATIGYGATWKGITEFYGEPRQMKQTIERVHAKSAMMRNRAATWSQNISYLRNELRGTANKVRNTYFVPMTIMQAAVDVPTWLGAYDKALGENVGEDRAIEIADQAVLDAQGGGQIGDLATAQRGKGVAQLFTRFYNYANTTFQLLAAVTNRQKHTPLDYARAAHDYLLLAVIPSVLLTVFRAALQGSDDDDDEALVEKMGRELIATNLGLAVLGREFSALVLGYDYQGPAGIRAVPAIGKAFGELKESVMDQEFDEDFWKALNMAGGLALGYPSLQIQRTSEGIIDLVNGDTDRITAPIFGPPR